MAVIPLHPSGRTPSDRCPEPGEPAKVLTLARPTRRPEYLEALKALRCELQAMRARLLDLGVQVAIEGPLHESPEDQPWGKVVILGEGELGRIADPALSGVVALMKEMTSLIEALAPRLRH
ncbi:MAG: hypothetical protein HY901_06885 [Deltaproteobacteria bacterium]|nr:hypothetical protein [Deltaproteobacteria bacterium]